MTSIRILFSCLLFSYFIMPVVISDLVFDNELYIYSGLQSQANFYSLVYGFIFLFYFNALFKPVPYFVQRGFSFKLEKWYGTRLTYYLMLIYSFVLLLYGWRLRSLGATREELLGGVDNFLLPGMSMLLLIASLFVVTKATRFQFYLFFLLFILIDLTFNGKIFSFIALVLFFVRLDFKNSAKRTILKAFAYWSVFGFLLLLLSGLMRKSLAGGEIDINAAGFVYLLGSEFLGVQASIGWGMDYFNNRLPLVLWDFVSNLQDFYISSVGHGLAASPGAYIEANFGVFGPVIAVVGCLIGLVSFRLVSEWFGFVAYLVIAINFQHFLRHGLDVFLFKILSQFIFLTLLAFAINPFGRREALQPSKNLTGI